jgi:hypothetical protein
MKIKNFVFIIGAMKCGTTGLFEYLAEHPQIAACSKKEPNFFSSKDNWNQGLNWYEGLWEWNPNVHKVALEASVDYSKAHMYPYVAQRIADLKADCKFIYIMRNPLDRIESHYIHGLAARWDVSKKSLTNHLDYHLIETSKYAKQLEAYYHFFSKEQILLLNLDDIKYESHSVLRKICEFLDIDDNYNFQGLNKVHNTNQGRRADSFLWLALSRFSTIRFLGQLISTEKRQAIRSFLSYQVKTDAKLSNEHKEFILNELKEDLQKLNFEYNFDTSCWGIKI